MSGKEMRKTEYLNLSDDRWNEKIESGLKILEKCCLCAHRCGVNRIDGELGVCDEGFFPKISSVCAHFGEEPPLSGINGSGTIFFSGCSLKCIYCQNYPISQLNVGGELPFDKFSGHMIDLQAKGCHNINLVTPTHFIPQIIIALQKACADGLSIPIVCNTSGYESIEALNLLDGIVDIYLVDMRYSKDSSAKTYSKVTGYSITNRNAVSWMASKVGELVVDGDGIGKRGLIVRLLILPGMVDELKDNLRFLSENLDFLPSVSLMSQYFPAGKAMETVLNRRITEQEYAEAFSYMESLGFTDGWVQEYEN